MGTIKTKEVTEYVESNIGIFHQGRLASLKSLKLKDVLKRKNPYLFRAKNITLAQDLVKMLLDAFLSSQEETIFGNFLERLAIHVNEKVYNGIKSTSQGIDLEFIKNNTRYIVAIKSGPNWGNSSQIRKMRDDFRKASQTVRSSNSKVHLIAVNGCCYGRNRKEDKGDYFKYCGQSFWEFISGKPDLYLTIIEPLGYSAKEKNEEFQEEYAKLVNQFTIAFSNEFVNKSGKIDWNKLVQFNSAR